MLLRFAFLPALVACMVVAAPAVATPKASLSTGRAGSAPAAKASVPRKPAAPPETAAASPWKTARPVKAIVIGGSISMYFAGNFGQYLQHGCRNVEVLNRGKVGAGGPALARILADEVLGNPQVMAGFQKGNGWILFQGGLNSVGSPELTIAALAQLFKAAHDGGLKVAALTLTPWGSDKDKRFVGWDGLRTHRATEQVVDFVLGKLTPKQALGRRAAERASETWLPGELPALAVDLWRSPLRAGKTESLRDEKALDATFDKSFYGKRPTEKAVLLAAARAVPQWYMDKKYRDFDHIHPNSQGHRLIASLLCQQAPEAWGCDCDVIRRAEWKGKVVPGK